MILLLLLCSGCLLTTDIQAVKDVEVVRFPVDMVIPATAPPVPLEQANPGSFRPEDIVLAGEPITLSKIAMYPAAVAAGTVATDSVPVTITQPAPAVEFLADGARQFGGPWGALVGSLLLTGVTAYSRHVNKKRALKAEGNLTNRERKLREAELMIDSTFNAFQGIRNNARLIPMDGMGEELEERMVDIMRQAHMAAGVAEEAARIVRRIKTTRIEPLIETQKQAA